MNASRWGRVRRWGKIAWLFTLGLMLLGFSSCRSNTLPPLTIATAANMQFVMAELTRSFTEATAIPTETIVASSGKLTAQIQAGAPFDVFVSADLKYPQLLFDQGLTLDPPRVYAQGRLVLWTLLDEPTRRSLGLVEGRDWALALKDERIRHVAVANPQTAPYGVAAIASLKYHQRYEPLQDKLVFGESIAQTNQFITSRAADIGFTAKSVVLSPNIQQHEHRGIWQDVDLQSYDPIDQGIVLLKPQSGSQSGSQLDDRQLEHHQLAAARSFYDFILSDQGSIILQKFGYDVPSGQGDE